MTHSIARLTDPLAGESVDEITGKLQAKCLLPRTTTIQPVPAEALSLTKTVVGELLEITPDKLSVPRRAGVVARPSFLLAGPSGSEIIFTGYSTYLQTDFYGLAPGMSYSALVSLSINSSASASVLISATGNPVTMALTNAAIGNARVEVHVPLGASSDGTAVVFMTPKGKDDSFSWYGTVLV